MLTFNGPNIYSHKPVVRMDVKLGCLNDVPTKDINNFNESLIELFPGLRAHKCSRGYIGGFLERLREGTYLAHVTEHVCLEIQKLIGHDVKFGRTRNITQDIYQIIFGCQSPIIGKACGYSTVKIINGLLEGCTSHVKDEIEKIKKLGIKHSFGPSTGAIVTEAKARGIPVKEVAGSGIIRLGYGRYQKYVSSTLFEGTSSIAADISCDKELTKALLDEVFIPVPRGSLCTTPDEAIVIARELGYPLVIKPKSGNQGKFVFTDIFSEEDLLNAFSQVKLYDDEVIVEEYIPGKDYRLLVVGGKFTAAAERIPAYVKGDGIHSIRELIESENRNELRGEDHEKPLTKIKIDECMMKVLGKQGLNLDTVPGRKQTVWLRRNANLSTGGTAVDCTDIVHEENRKAAELAAKTIGLDVAGIDMVIPDISRPICEGYGAVVEVNAAPGIRMHLYPAAGTRRNVAKAIVDMIYPHGSPYTIPIISITGTNGKTTTARMISRILQDSGLTVGMTTTHGIYINRECIEEGDTTGPKSAARVLNNRQVEAAVLETARGGIIRGGLAYDKADVAVFTNLSGDHLGIDGINTMDELLNVKSLVIEAVKENGYCILNADDKYVMKAAENAKGKLILISTDFYNPYIKKQIKSGGCALYTDKGDICISVHGLTLRMVSVKDIPATMKGALTHNIYNSMAAAAAAYAAGVHPDIIAKSLKAFTTNAEDNPGRFNVYELGNVKVVLDYGHNQEGYRVTVEGLKKLNPKRLVGIIGVPGDRRDPDIEEIGRISANFFDFIIIKEDKDLRGRQPLETINTLRLGAVEAGMAQEKIEVVPDEAEALKKAIDNAEDGDVIVVFFEKRERLVDVINSYLMQPEANAKDSKVALTI
jgi:cyanophycin synthetase